MKLHLWGTDFRRSDADFRAKLFVAPEKRATALQQWLSLGFHDLVYLPTCNRVEFYTTASDHFCGTRALWVRLLETLGLSEEAFYRGYHFEGKSALRHLLRVTSSLESLAIGETQIVGQLKDALDASRAAGVTVGASLDQAFDLAFQTSRRIRAQTKIGEKPTSIASLALDHFERCETTHPARSAVLVGRSPMCVSIVQWLRKNRPECAITWVNRTPDALKALPASEGCSLRSLQDFLAAPGEFTHFFTSTASPAALFTTPFFEKLSGQPKLFFDFAQPADMAIPARAPAGWEWVSWEDLSRVATENRHLRSQAVAQAERMVDEALRSYCREQKAGPLLKEFSAAESRVLEDLAQALITLEQECPSLMGPEVKRWAEKLLRKNWHRSREHLREVLHRASDQPEQSTLV